MPAQLLPASAAAFAPRASSVNVVVGSKVDLWLTKTLRRINRAKRPLNSVPQQHRFLVETLSSETAIWTLASIMLPGLSPPPSPTTTTTTTTMTAEYAAREERKVFGCHFLIHIEAYIVHVDMVLRDEVAFKLTAETIDALVGYHRDVYCVNVLASSPGWLGKEQQCKKLHEEFVQAVNKFVFHAHVSALEGLEENGAGELLCGKSDEVRTGLLNLMKPLVPPPPPRAVDVLRHQSRPHPPPPAVAPPLPISPVNLIWTTAASVPPLVDTAWAVGPSSPNVVSSSPADVVASVWPGSMQMQQDQLSPSRMGFMQPQPLFVGAPSELAVPGSALPLPSMYAHNQCAMNAIVADALDWQRFQMSTPIV